MKRFAFTFVLTLAFACSGQAQQDKDIISQINRIKLDSLMLYGESTERNEADAASDAINALQETVREYGKSHESIRYDSSKVETLKHMRGNNVRFFAYVHVDSLFAKPLLPAIDTDRFEMELNRLKNWSDVTKLINEEPYSSHVRYGDVDFSTDGETLRNSYVFVTKGNDSRIYEIYSPCSKSNTRRAVKAGSETASISFKTGDKVFWVIIEN